MRLFDQLRKGSTQALILTLLSERPMYCYQIAREIERPSKDYFTMKKVCFTLPSIRWREMGSLEANGAQ
jgi:hypothetical protein